MSEQEKSMECRRPEHCAGGRWGLESGHGHDPPNDRTFTCNTSVRRHPRVRRRDLMNQPAPVQKETQDVMVLAWLFGR